VLLVCAAATAATAQQLETMKVRARRGDTLELLAAEYYGDRQHAVFIMKANNLTHPRKLRAGERIKIPIQREITASVGDTLEGISDEYMGDARRAEFLAAFNNMSADATITAGQRIVIPFHVTHKAAARETVESIAAAYLGDSKKAALLRRYNFTEQEALAVDEKLVIPIFNVRVRPEKLPPPDPGSTEREARLREMEEKAALALPNARAAWRSGEYGRVKKLLVEIDLDYLPPDTAVDVGILLASTYIAYDDDDSAFAKFENVLRRKPGHAIDPEQASPKVREIWKKAGGTVAE
jgi:LysM repeat protein